MLTKEEIEKNRADVLALFFNPDITQTKGVLKSSMHENCYCAEGLFAKVLVDNYPADFKWVSNLFGWEFWSDRLISHTLISYKHLEYYFQFVESQFKSRTGNNLVSFNDICDYSLSKIGGIVKSYFELFPVKENSLNDSML